MRCIWDPRCSVGVEQLDRQHEAISEKLNDLERELPSGDAARLGCRAASLKRECAFHFEAEEEFLRGLRYPGLAEHAAAHRECLARIGELEARPEACSGTILEGLASWLENHVLGLDADYARWMREQAAKMPEEKQRAR